ncbi:MAG: 2-hydroxyacyl-CoA dehydratase, partial [Desulfovibrionaceae bacterium]
AGIAKSQLQEAVTRAFTELDTFQAEVQAQGEAALRYIEEHDTMGIVLAGHPYHIDPEVHHGIPDYMASLGIAVLTEDSVAHLAEPAPLRVVDQWTFHSRLYRAAALVAQHPRLSLVHLVSFGCGLSALTAEQMEEILAASGQMYTQIKIDEGHNIGPARIRIRSLLASMHYRQHMPAKINPFVAPLPPPFTVEMRATHTIIIGHVAPFHSRLMEVTFRACGYKTATLPPIERADVEEGLRLVNNDACYPAILTVGQLVRVARSGAFDSTKVALAVYQSGGGCRATNYYALLRKALVDCGLAHVPIISFNLQNKSNNPGFTVDWPMIKRSFMGCCMADLLSRLYRRVKPYEAEPGSAAALSEYWLRQCEAILPQARRAPYARLAHNMVAAFEALPLQNIPRKPCVAIVGEILVKYHAFANNRLAEIIEAEGGEVLLPDILDFFLYCLYDDVFRHQHLAGPWQAAVKSRVFRKVVEWYRAPMVTALKRSQRFTQPTPFNEMLHIARSIVSLGHQAGEGWLLTAEMLKYLEHGVGNILCVQPFGCLPNHITGKGMFREIKRRYPQANLVAIDYDQGTSETNQINRIKLMMNMAKEHRKGQHA